MKKRMAALCMAGILALLGGCSTAPTEPTQQETATGQTEALEDFDIVLDWYPNAVHSFIYVAMEKGYYAEEGLQVNVKFPANTNDAMSLTAAGKADMGIYYLQDTIMAVANEDVPIKSVGALVQSPLNIILSLKEKNITSPADLVGKTVGNGGSAIAEAILKCNMETVLGKGAIEDVNVIDVGFDIISSMTTGKVDATLGGLVNHEVPQMESEGFEVQYYFPNEYGVPDYYELVLLTGTKELEEQPEKIQKFLRASQKGFEYTKEHPEEALQILLDNQNEENFPLQKEVEEQSMDILLPLMESDETPFLSQTEQVWQENIDWMVEQGLIEEGSVTAGELFENVVVE